MHTKSLFYSVVETPNTVKKLKMAKKVVLKNHDTMVIMVTFFGQHYFHNVNLRFASIHIMKIMLTKKSDIIVHNVRIFFRPIHYYIMGKLSK